MLKSLKSKMNKAIVKWLLNEKSNETSDKGAWIFWSIMIGLLAALLYKVGTEQGFQNIINTFINITNGNTTPSGGWAN
jgi:TRAP-type mannitol/chloroaromatic compound transport system permease small subunit